VACILYKKEADIFKILLVERTDDAGHWQLPQGGTDGQSLEEAGARELQEEVGTDKFTNKSYFNNVWCYKFDKSTGRYKTQRQSGYKGQKQGLFIAEFLGCDSDIKINFWDHSSWKWVDVDDVINVLHECRKDGAKMFLEKFNKTIK
jgi:8-oxo-dGTP pyrophosphatase MutT (NUDIX family)